MAYEGERNADFEPHGFGVITYLWGDVYEGEWRNGKMGPRGIYKFTNQGFYAGGFNDEGKRSGAGILKMKDGSVYEGQFEDDLQDGVGRYTYPNGDKYMGQWVSGQRSGFGVMNRVNQTIFEGEWRNDSERLGVCSYGNGDLYKGQWYKGKREGKGVIRFGSKAVYFGEMCRGCMHGQGSLSMPDGSHQTGLWNTGCFFQQMDIDLDLVDTCEQLIEKAMDVASLARKMLKTSQNCVDLAKNIAQKAHDSALKAVVADTARQARGVADQARLKMKTKIMSAMARESAKTAQEFVRNVGTEPAKEEQAEEQRAHHIEDHGYANKFGRILHGQYADTLVDILQEFPRKVQVVIRQVSPTAQGGRGVGQELFVEKKNMACFSDLQSLYRNDRPSINLVEEPEELVRYLKNHLTIRQANEIIEHRKRYGEYTSFDALHCVKGVSKELAHQMSAVFCLTAYAES